MTQDTDSDRLVKMEVQLGHSNELLRELKELVFSLRNQLQEHNQQLGRIVTQDENTRKQVAEHEVRIKALEDKLSGQTGSFNILRLVAGLVFTVLISVAGWSILETIDQKAKAEVQRTRVDELYKRIESQEGKHYETLVKK